MGRKTIEYNQIPIFQRKNKGVQKCNQKCNQHIFHFYEERNDENLQNVNMSFFFVRHFHNQRSEGCPKHRCPNRAVGCSGKRLF